MPRRGITTQPELITTVLEESTLVLSNPGGAEVFISSRRESLNRVDVAGVPLGGIPIRASDPPLVWPRFKGELFGVSYANSELEFEQ